MRKNKMRQQLRKGLRIFTFFLISLFWIGTATAYHGGGKFGGSGVSALTLVLVILGMVVGFTFIIWLLRKSTMSLNKKGVSLKV